MNASAGLPSDTWSDFVKRVLIVVVIVGVLLMLSEAVHAAARMFLVLFAGILFGVFLNGLGRLIESWTRFSYRWSLTIAVVLLLVLVAGLGWYMVPQISRQVDQFLQQSGSAWSQLQQQLTQYRWGNWLVRQVQASLGQGSGPGGGALNLSQIGQVARAVVSGLLFYLAAAAIVFFVGLYLGGDPNRYREGLVKLVPIPRRKRIRNVLNTTGETLWHWLIGRLILMAIIGVSTGVGLWLMGIPLPVTLGLIAGLLTFVPNLGPIIAFIPQALLAYRVGPQMVLYVLIFNIVLQTAESYVITPLVQQYEVELPPAMIISVQVVLGMLVGWLGLLLATPLAASAMVLLRMLYVEDVLGDPSVAPNAGTSDARPDSEHKA